MGGKPECLNNLNEYKSELQNTFEALDMGYINLELKFRKIFIGICIFIILLFLGISILTINKSLK
jgi:hypothetical protein